MRDKGTGGEVRHANKGRMPITWDSNIIETSSLNQFRHDNTSTSSHHSSKRSRSNRSNRKNKSSTKLIFLKRNPEIGFGFSIRGGVEHGTGIFVSSINKYSDAHQQGLQVGDQILQTNKYSFEGIRHDVAVEFIQHHKGLRLLVLSLGIIPGTKIEHTQYQWIDCYGRTCSPLLNSHHISRDANNSNDSNESNGGIRLLEEEDERKVNIVVGNNARLGLLIRGGYEYGLGIFVAGIDVDSVADRLGIMVGEQILDVNGIDFLNISHADAAHIIRTSKMMTMTLKDVEKVPLARIVLDHTEWINKRNVRTRTSSGTSNETSPRDGYRDSIIQLGIAGSQLHHQSATGPTSYQWIEEKAHDCLVEDEWTTLKYYIREYVQRNITVNGLVLSILDLLDTKDKRSLIPEVRGIVRAQDINTYDEMVLRIEVEQIKAEKDEDNNHESLLEPDHDHESEHENVVSTYLAENNQDIFVDEPLIEAVHLEHVSLDDPDIDEEARVANQPFPGGSRNFKYEALPDETYNSTAENITEESMLEHSPHKTYSPSSSQKLQPRSIMDEEIPEIPSEENVYSKVYKRKNRNKYASMLKQYEEKEDIRSNSSNSPPTATKNNENVPFISDREGQDETDFEQNKLGYAFSFLSKEEEIEENLVTYEESSPNYSQNNRLDSDDDGSVVSVSSLENGYIATPPNAVKYTQSEPVRHYGDLNGDVKNRRQSAKVVDIDFESEGYNSLQNFQPRAIARSLAFETPQVSIQQPTPTSSRKSVLQRKESSENYFQSRKDSSDHTAQSREESLKHSVLTRKVSSEHTALTRKESSDSDFSNSFQEKRGFVKRTQSNESRRSQSPDFNSASSIDHRISNFSVNDIMRQSFLPTTRLDYDPLNTSVDNSPGNTNINDTSGSLSLNTVNTLNIQNQYQYERSRSLSFESIPTKIEEIKNYGKPVLAKSPRPDFSPSSTRTNSLSHKFRTIKPDEIDERRHFLNLPKLKKTKNSDIYLKEGNADGVLNERENYVTTNNISNERENYVITNNVSEERESYISEKNISEERESYVTTSKNTTVIQQPVNLSSDIDFRSFQNKQPNSTRFHRQQQQQQQPVSNAFNGVFTTSASKIDDNAAIDALNGRVTERNTRVATDKTEHSTTDIDFKSFQNELQSTTKFYRQPATDYNQVLSRNESKIEHSQVRLKLSTKPSVVETDLRANDDASTYKRNKTNLSEKLKARVDAFNVNNSDVNIARNQNNALNDISTKVNDSNNYTLRKKEFIYSSNVKEPEESEIDDLPGRIVILPRLDDDPGFTIDASEGLDKNRELFISEIQDLSLDSIQTGDVIIGINGTLFKKGLQKGLANLMLRNAFNNHENKEVRLHLKS